MKRFVLPVILQIACMILQNVSALCQALLDKEIASRIHAYLKPFSETGNFIGTVLVCSRWPHSVSTKLWNGELWAQRGSDAGCSWNCCSESYENHLRHHIFEPAGMQDSGSDGDASRLVPSAASGCIARPTMAATTDRLHLVFVSAVRSGISAVWVMCSPSCSLWAQDFPSRTSLARSHPSRSQREYSRHNSPTRSAPTNH